MSGSSRRQNSTTQRKQQYDWVTQFDTMPYRSASERPTSPSLRTKSVGAQLNGSSDVPSVAKDGFLQPEATFWIRSSSRPS
jgi:hypothetical protein